MFDETGVDAGVDPGQLACSVEKDKKEKEFTDDLYEYTVEIDEEELEGMMGEMEPVYSDELPD